MIAGGSFGCLPSHNHAVLGRAAEVRPIPTFSCFADLPRRLLDNFHWIPAYCWQRLTRGPKGTPPAHLIIALADHFEPSHVPDSAAGTYADLGEQERRLERWCREYPRLVDPWRDHDSRPFCHTYFYPAEQYNSALVERLADHCQAGWGEIEVQLHHGVDRRDTVEHTRRAIVEFKEALVDHGCLSRWDGTGPARYGFVHGNWALANSARGSYCGVDSEMQILAETGCYADFTLPSAPNPAQVGKINSLYECALPLDHQAPHRLGRDLEVDRPPEIFPLIIQGPLLLSFGERRSAWFLPRIENGELTNVRPPTMQRLRLWREAAITVRGRPEWVFIKLHCHGMDPRDEKAMLGETFKRFLRELVEGSKSGGEYTPHFVSAREMVNITLAACDGREGNPGEYRDYRLRLIHPVH